MAGRQSEQIAQINRENLQEKDCQLHKLSEACAFFIDDNDLQANLKMKIHFLRFTGEIV